MADSALPVLFRIEAADQGGDAFHPFEAEAFLPGSGILLRIGCPALIGEEVERRKVLRLTVPSSSLVEETGIRILRESFP